MYFKIQGIHLVSLVESNRSGRHEHAHGADRTVNSDLEDRLDLKRLEHCGVSNHRMKQLHEINGLRWILQKIADPCLERIHQSELICNSHKENHTTPQKLQQIPHVASVPIWKCPGFVGSMTAQSSGRKLQDLQYPSSAYRDRRSVFGSTVLSPAK